MGQITQRHLAVPGSTVGTYALYFIEACQHRDGLSVLKGECPSVPPSAFKRSGTPTEQPGERCAEVPAGHQGLLGPD